MKIFSKTNFSAYFLFITSCLIILSSAILISCKFLSFSASPHENLLVKNTMIQFSQDSSLRNLVNLESPKTYRGCEYVSAPEGSLQQKFVGFQSTGNSCSIAVESRNKVSVDFIEEKNIPLTALPASAQSDIHFAILQNIPGVLVVQFRRNQVTSFSYSHFDKQGTLIYGLNGGNKKDAPVFNKKYYARSCTFNNKRDCSK